MPKDQPAAFEVKSSDVVFAGRVWDVVTERFDYNGQLLQRDFVKHTGAVAVLALDDKNRILMIRQYRHPVREYLWEIPAGLLDVPGESRLEAAKRELFEETGYQACKWVELQNFYTTPGGNDEQITIFCASDLKHVGHELDLEGEESDMIKEWVDFEVALESVRRSEIKSPQATIGIMALALALKADANS